MDHGTAREVKGAGGGEEAVGGPEGVGDGAVDEEVPEEDEDQHRRAPHPLCPRKCTLFSDVSLTRSTCFCKYTKQGSGRTDGQVTPE